jgi:hypothetical protein
MPVNELVKCMPEMVAAPCVRVPIIISVCFHQVYVPFLGMERNEDATTKHELAPEEHLNFLPVFTD